MDPGNRYDSYKYYVILYDQDQVIFPIKAKNKPKGYHEWVPWYCPGSPVFFGGAPEKKKRSYSRGDIVQTLKKEVTEESCRAYQLHDAQIETYLHRKPYRKDSGKTELSTFYCAGPNQWGSSGHWPSKSDWDRLGDIDSAYNETCFAGPVMRTAFDEPSSSSSSAPHAGLTLDQIYRILIVAARTGSEAWAQTQFSGSPTEEFRDSEYSTAFVKFFNLWLKYKLPGLTKPAPPPEPPPPAPPPEPPPPALVAPNAAIASSGQSSP